MTVPGPLSLAELLRLSSSPMSRDASSVPLLHADLQGGGEEKGARPLQLRVADAQDALKALRHLRRRLDVLITEEEGSEPARHELGYGRHQLRGLATSMVSTLPAGKAAAAWFKKQLVVLCPSTPVAAHLLPRNPWSSFLLCSFLPTDWKEVPRKFYRAMYHSRLCCWCVRRAHRNGPGEAKRLQATLDGAYSR